MMKRPLFLLLTGLVLGEAAGVKMGWKGIFIPVFLVLLAGLFFLLPKKENRYFVMAVIGIFSFGSGYLLYLTQIHEDSIDVMMGDESVKVSLLGEVDALKINKEDHYQITLKNVTCTVDDENYSLKGKCLVNGIENDGMLYPGMKITLNGSLSKYSEPTNPGEFNQKIYYASKGIFYSLYAYGYEKVSGKRGPAAFLFSLKERISKAYENLLDEDQSGLLEAIVLGDKTNLSEDMRALYEENGVAHLLAVSGLHVSVIGGLLYRFLRKRNLSYFPSCLSGVVLLLMYGLMTGFGSSIQRAVFMYLFFLVSEWLGLEYDMISAMSLSGILMLLEYPARAVEGGFQISFLSIFAIGAVLPFLNELKERREKRIFCPGEIPGKAYRLFYRYLFTGILLSAVTLPFLLFYYDQWSPYSIFLNLLLIPLMSPLMICAILGGVTGAFSLMAGTVAIFPAKLILILFETVLKIVHMLPGSLIVTGCPGIGGIFLIYGVEAVLVLIWYYSFKKGLFFLACFLTACYLMKPANDLKITLLDIGQGECILLRMPDGKNALIDGGSTSKNNTAKYIIKPALKFYGISYLDYVFITHVDEDHISGLVELMDSGYEIKNVVMSDLLERDETYKEVVKAAKEDHAAVYPFSIGDQVSGKSISGDLTLTCIHPSAAYETEDRNDGSLILYLKYKDFDMLFTGDVGADGEADAMAYLRTHRKEYEASGLFDGLDVLKIAHHGSEYSTSDEWLDLFKPHAGVLSCGKNNKYGHPHAALLSRFTARDIPVYRTDSDGAITITTDGSAYEILGYH